MKRSFTHNGDKLVGNGISSLKSVRFRSGMNGHERIGPPRTIGPSNDVNCSIHYLIFCSFAFINNNEVVHGYDTEDTEVTLNIVQSLFASALGGSWHKHGVIGGDFKLGNTRLMGQDFHQQRSWQENYGILASLDYC